MIRIRSAEPRDAAALCEILNHIIRNTTITFNSVEKLPEELEEAIATADVYLVIEDAGTVLGFATYGPFRSGVGYATVKEHSICLHTNVRGKGHGAKLLAALEDSARARGVRHMIAGVSGENTTGIKFHETQGYAPVGQMPDIGRKFDRAIDLLLMQKSL